MSGNLTVPNDFALVVADQPGSTLGGTTGGNFGAIVSYINAREITFGLIAARPAAGVSGRIFFATDTGVLAFDNGSAWVQVAPAVAASAIGTQDVIGGIALNNAATPLTKWDLASADSIRLRNPTTGGIRVVLAPPTVTVDIALAGPAANGRDQAAALTASTAAHFYYIGTGTGNPQGVVSPNPPTTGPVLPATYTEWAYAGPVMLTGATQLVPTIIRGTLATYSTRQNALTGGGATIETVAALSAFVPPNAGTISLFLQARTGGSTAAFATVRLVPTVDFVTVNNSETGGTLLGRPQFPLEVPNMSQQIRYLVSGCVLDVWVLGYTFPGG